MVGLGPWPLLWALLVLLRRKETKRIEELEAAIASRFEQTACSPARSNPADPAAKLSSAGVVKSLTFRNGQCDDSPAHLLGRTEPAAVCPCTWNKALGLRLNPLP